MMSEVTLYIRIRYGQSQSNFCLHVLKKCFTVQSLRKEYTTNRVRDFLCNRLFTTCGSVLFDAAARNLSGQPASVCMSPLGLKYNVGSVLRFVSLAGLLAGQGVLWLGTLGLLG